RVDGLRERDRCALRRSAGLVARGIRRALRFVSRPHHPARPRAPKVDEARGRCGAGRILQMTGAGAIDLVSQSAQHTERLGECLEAGGVTVIEWADRAGAALPGDRLDVRLAHLAETRRHVELTSTGPRSARILAELRSDVAAGA